MSKKLFASFIGINAYAQSPLSGCIKDVLDMDLLLREQSAQQEGFEYIPCYFLSPNETDNLRIEEHKSAIKSPELKYEPATFESVTKKAFTHLKNAVDGDICCLYYSGHGSQVEAPEIFWDSKPDRQNETIVCVDSRDPRNPDSRDIIDKELAYLLWDALEGKDVHCLVVMDCCHSGNNTRAMALQANTNDIQPYRRKPNPIRAMALQTNIDDTRYRFIPSSKNKIPIEKYLGYKEGFYKVINGKASIGIARYVHLAACRDSEKAQESNNGGLFSTKLIQVLRSGGTARSYRELVQELTITIRNRNSQQNPIAYARADVDLDLQFLGKGSKPYQSSYEVRFDFKTQKWLMYGGAIHNITPSSGNAVTVVKIVGTLVHVKVIEVAAVTSILDDKDMTSLNKENEAYQAIIESMANAPVIIGLSPQLMDQPKFLTSLKAEYKRGSYLFFNIDFENKNLDSYYQIQITKDYAYVLTKVGSDVPFFKRETGADFFLKKIDAVCKWLSVAELKNTETNISKDDFIFSLTKVEGERFDEDNSGDWEIYKGRPEDIFPGKEVIFIYEKDKQPAFRLQINFSNDTVLQSCYLGALYMDSKFGIVHDLIHIDKGNLIKGKSPINLSWIHDCVEHHTILLELDPVYGDYGINEITDFLKIIVSTKPIDLSQYKQESLKLEPVARKKTRSIGLTLKKAEGNAEEKTDWTVFTFPFRIVGPNKEKKLEQGRTVNFCSFTIDVPSNFSATAFAATGNDLQHKLNTITRSVNAEDDKLTQFIAPPQSLWGDVISDTDPFCNGFSPASDNGIQVLEIYPDDMATELKLVEGQEMRIKPTQERSRTASEDGFEETIVPYGYNEALQLYIPLGFTDDNGIIHINELPSATPGIIRGDRALSRSVGSSIKLFFKKIFAQGTVNTLTLYELTYGQPWEKITEDPGEMRAVFEENKGSEIVLLIHGIFGSMKDITGSLREAKDFPTAARFVLAYDYENISNTLANTAKMLKEDLSKAGFADGNGSKLSIVAHSMGGLVARRLVEAEGASAFVKQLIFAGTPNAGSELANLKSAVSGLITHALNVTGPIKYALTGLCFLLKKLHLDPGETLSEMSTGSPFLINLAISKPPQGVRYSILGGNTFLLKYGYDGDDYFLKKVSESLKQNVVYPGLSTVLFKDKPNDMAVTLESMQTITGFDASRMHIVANDHLSYFSEPACQKKLIALLNEHIQDIAT
ncbi:MAG: caspase family protein [Saprospiraceae bacterium]|nr:caspase family protein [Candidatus Vicinibacter affinis]